MSPVRLPVVLEKRLLKSELCWIKGIRQSHSNDPWVRKCVRGSFRVRVGARRGLGDGAFSRQERSPACLERAVWLSSSRNYLGSFSHKVFLGQRLVNPPQASSGTGSNELYEFGWKDEADSGSFARETSDSQNLASGSISVV